MTRSLLIILQKSIFKKEKSLTQGSFLSQGFLLEPRWLVLLQQTREPHLHQLQDQQRFHA